ncbi:GNAT family N-acetyltransferase [Cytobacillus spongiae]|uniref:GNAT family N-acetyltransferase n=1 Tax=Cytobacillus spongiae TaxID=2901381 RepID=UPI001F1F759B|nr:GNAT family N-acetyltransferase [Cytobacillus spongiae]UII54341.1 GNAT family N-acetyltransferase [Cytobacillus spongiae]
MVSFEKVHEMELVYLESLSKRMELEWGSLFVDSEQPNYYDANHAHITKAVEHPSRIIAFVKEFYQSKGLIPRFYIYNLEKQTNLLKELKFHHFKVEEFISPVQLWNHQVTHSTNERVTVEYVTENNFQQALEIECSIKEFGGREVREKAFPLEFRHASYTHYLLKYDNIPCSSACIFTKDKQARLESVATLEEYRGKGLIGELISFIQRDVKRAEYEQLWVFPINEAVEKVYSKYGFDTVGKMKTAHAYLSGKGIKEIQGQ